jgi:mannosyltransferase OCH1-like enzyme
MIPKHVYQTHKSLDYIEKKEDLREARKSWQKWGDFECHFFSNDEVESFMRERDPRIYEAYQKLPPELFVMKADLWRYCVIYEYGGIYSDADTVCLTNPTILTDCRPGVQLVFAPENDCHLCQWTFAAPPKSPILWSVIQLSVSRILETPVSEWKKNFHFIHYLTGPGVFTNGIENYLKENNLEVFPNKKDYARKHSHVMAVFRDDYFHSKVIRHIFTGGKEDGWTFLRENFCRS